MLDKVIEQLGQATQQKIADAVATIQDKSEAERVYLVDLIADTHSNFSTQLEEKERQLTDAINDVDTRNQARYVEETQQIVEKLQELEVYAAQLATIKDGEQGEQGLQGEPGLDKPLLEPVQLVDKDYPKSTLGLHNGGLWISTKDSVGCPESDPHAWSCILDSMTTMSIDLQEDHTFKLSVRMATGKLIEDSFKIPFPEHKGIWEEGEYKQGQIVTKGSSFWQAMEDTAGEPPGNGWKQILTAPRGKVGPAGKSIEGPQGKPGRNGMDAKLPPNFVDDLIAIASERKAFEDGREAAYAITSFRGYFQRGESYRSGDVVNFDGGIYLCTTSGTFESIASSAGSFELILGVPSIGPSAAYMLWQGAWQQKTYNGGSVVRDGDWTMVATTQTNERAAPIAVGPEFYLYEGTMTPFENTAKTVLYGQRFANLEHAVFVNGYKIDVIADNQYQIYSVTDVTTKPVFNLLNTVVATTTEQLEFAIPQQPIPQGKVFDIVVYLTEPDPTPVQFVYQYDYLTPQNLQTPLSGQISHGRGATDTMRINHIDNQGTDRTGVITGLTVGDTITAGVLTWSVQVNTNNGTFSTINVAPAAVSTAGVQNITFETKVATPITIGRDVDYWDSNPDVVGLFVADGNYDGLVPSQNAYGIIDVQFQDAVVPEDWEVVTPGSGGASTTQLTTQEKAWVQESSGPFIYASATTIDDVWVEMGRLPMASGDAIRGKVSLTARRTDALDYHASEWAIIAWSDGTLTVDDKKDYEVGSNHVDLQAVADGNDLVISVRGDTGETWDVNGTAFYRSIV